MPEIAERTGLFTTINVFAVERSNQQALLDLLAGAAQTAVRDMPGFVSAALHRSLDGTRVTMHGQWQSAEHYQAARSAPDAAYLQQVLAIAEVDGAGYEVARVFVGPSKPAGA